ncbi:FAD-linked oxidase C-terminal domain-containing protein [Pseudomonas aeruginosa]|nr:FAD-linked oxidase C-terminal domain-containing protein [Pseudomonas aeruginosa]
MGAEPLPLPYLREALWQAGYAVDTLETATDWSNVDGLLQKIEASLRDGLAAEGEKVHVFTHLSHVYGEGRASIPPTCSVRPRAMRRRWSAGSVPSDAASQAIVDNRGTISHQHGVGKDHAPYLPREKGELGVAALRHGRSLDPAGRLNRGTLLQD